MFGFSIIVCTYNGSNTISQVLRNLFLLERNSQIGVEIIVINNNSTDDTEDIIKDLIIKEPSQNILLYKELQIGKGHAFWKGVENSKYDNIIICDDDNLLDSSYLLIAIDQIKASPNFGAIGGYGVPIVYSPKPKWFNYFKAHFATDTQYLDALSGELFGAGLVLNKKALDKLLPFRAELFLLNGRSGNNLLSGEDTELTKILFILGYDILYNKDLLFSHIILDRKLNMAYLNAMFRGFGASYPYLFIYDLIIRKVEFPGLHILKLIIFSLIKLPYYFIFPPKRFGRHPYFNWNIGNLSTLWRLKFSLSILYKVQLKKLEEIEILVSKL